VALESNIHSWRRDVLDRFLRLNPRSEAMHRRAEGVLPGGDTRSGVVLDPFSPSFVRGERSHLTDLDGNVRLDLANNSTSLAHGHAHPAITAAVQAQAAAGTAWSGPSPGVVEWAEMLCDRIPSIERVRFTNSGSEAVAMALKVARAFTGRPAVMKMDGAYHGNSDQLEFRLDPQGSARPVPEMDGIAPNVADNVLVGRFNDTDRVVELIERNAARLAAVVITPVATIGWTEPAPEFLKSVRAVTDRYGVLMVYDEVISVRVARGGGQERYGVLPDLTALGKIIGGGLPVGAFGGRADVMRLTEPATGPAVLHAGTFNANPLTAAAGRASLDLLVPDAYVRLEETGERMRAGLADAIHESGLPLNVTGVGSLIGVELGAPDQDWASMNGMIEATLQLAFLNHGLHALRMCTTTVITDEEVNEAVAAVRDALFELASYLPAA
jgi:glutamate-1-semialdehyde 2,1-aminomutase